MAIIALLSDIHANAYALRAVLREVAACPGVEKIVFGGDIVGYGPHAAECVRLVREAGGHAVMGNHDWFTLMARERPEFLPAAERRHNNPVWAGIHHALRSLDDDALDWLATLPLTLDVPGAIVAHASLHAVESWPYLSDTAAALPSLELLQQAHLELGFFGHTHQQEWFALPGSPAPEALADWTFHLPAGGVCAVLVGAVGQPRSADTRAAWTLWDSDARRFIFRRSEYPAARTAADILAAGLPQASARRLLPGK